jgi:hypothetical protein
MTRHKKNITEEELAIFKQESLRKRRISLKKAKSKYQKSSKGKECAMKYYEKNRDVLIEKARLQRAFDRDKRNMVESYFLLYQNDHPEFFEPV